MPTTDTPLRYPGGKSQLTPLVIDLLAANNLFYGEYAEPFAGGAGIAMTLLLNDYVSRVYLNDIDPAIHAFWSSVLNDTDGICERIERVEVTIDEWHRQRAIYLRSGQRNASDLGFATLFLNRTNRSGILKGGVIGGLKQTGNYRLDCRFNRADLTRKIRRIAAYRDQIVLTRLDATKFLEDVVPTTSSRSLVNLDPPYFVRGQELYTSFYEAADHERLASLVRSLARPWMLTYDDAPEIRTLYKGLPIYGKKLTYSAQVKRPATELLVLGPNLVAPRMMSPLAQAA